MERGFFFTLAFSVLIGPVYALITGPQALVPASLAVSILTLLALIADFLGKLPKKKGLIYAVLLGAAMPFHYAATGPVIQAMNLQNMDQNLIAIDRALFGFLFPDGQISLWLDQIPLINPGAFLGRLVTDFLQICYISYYFWGYGLIFILARKYYRGESRAWENLQYFLTAWLGAYLLNYWSYITVPAIGPQFVFADLYQHEITGFGLAEYVRGLIRSNQETLQDCFPSGHTAMSWITAIYACKLSPKYGRWAVWGAILITVATLFLRYHYIIDLLAAIPLVLLGLYWGHFRQLSKS